MLLEAPEKPSGKYFMVEMAMIASTITMEGVGIKVGGELGRDIGRGRD